MSLSNYQKQITKWGFTTFLSLIIIISGVTTYSFFETFFPSIISADWVPVRIAMAISGLIGFTIFDVAALAWLRAFLAIGETKEQRAIAQIMMFFCFLCSAVASGAYLALTGQGLMEAEFESKEMIADVSVVIVISGIIANFASGLFFTRFSKASKESVRISDRDDKIDEDRQNHLKELDKLVKTKVKRKLDEKSDEIAERQSDKIVDEFEKAEMNRYLAREKSETDLK